MTDSEFRLLLKQARVEAQRTVLSRNEPQGNELYESRARHADFGAAAH